MSRTLLVLHRALPFRPHPLPFVILSVGKGSGRKHACLLVRTREPVHIRALRFEKTSFCHSTCNLEWVTSTAILQFHLFSRLSHLNGSTKLQDITRFSVLNKSDSCSFKKSGRAPLFNIVFTTSPLISRFKWDIPIKSGLSYNLESLVYISCYFKPWNVRLSTPWYIQPQCCSRPNLTYLSFMQRDSSPHSENHI